jgi:hypothetical protein
MNNYLSRGRGHRPLQLRLAQVAVGLTAALLAAACSSSPSPGKAGGSDGSGGSGGSGGGASAVAWSQCVRAHGIPNFPDPDSSGQVPKETASQLGVSDAVLAAATGACENLNPNNPQTPQTSQQILANGLTLAKCMRAHGVPKFPDPTTSSSGSHFVISVSNDGFSPSDPQIIAKARACQQQLPAGSRLPQVMTAA